VLVDITIHDLNSTHCRIVAAKGCIVAVHSFLEAMVGDIGVKLQVSQELKYSKVDTAFWGDC